MALVNSPLVWKPSSLETLNLKNLSLVSFEFINLSQTTCKVVLHGILDTEAGNSRAYISLEQTLRLSLCKHYGLISHEAKLSRLTGQNITRGAADWYESDILQTAWAIVLSCHRIFGQHSLFPCHSTSHGSHGTRDQLNPHLPVEILYGSWHKTPGTSERMAGTTNEDCWVIK